MWVTVNIKKLSVWLLPTFLRRSKNIAFLHCLLEPLIWFYEKTLYETQHTHTVMYMEKVLNEWFKVPGYDPVRHKATKKVHIVDAFNPKRVYLYLPIEEKPIYDDIVYLYDEEQLGAEYFNFIVKVPKEYQYNENSLRAVIDFYKQSAKKYQIEHY